MSREINIDVMWYLEFNNYDIGVLFFFLFFVNFIIKILGSLVVK